LAEPILSRDSCLASDGCSHKRVTRALQHLPGRDCIRFSLRSANGSLHRIPPVQSAPRRDSRLGSGSVGRPCDEVPQTGARPNDPHMCWSAIGDRWDPMRVVARPIAGEATAGGRFFQAAPPRGRRERLCRVALRRGVSSPDGRRLGAGASTPGIRAGAGASTGVPAARDGGGPRRTRRRPRRWRRGQPIDATVAVHGTTLPRTGATAAPWRRVANAGYRCAVPSK